MEVGHKWQDLVQTNPVTVSLWSSRWGWWQPVIRVQWCYPTEANGAAISGCTSINTSCVSICITTAGNLSVTQRWLVINAWWRCCTGCQYQFRQPLNITRPNFTLCVHYKFISFNVILCRNESLNIIFLETKRMRYKKVFTKMYFHVSLELWSTTKHFIV